jgi:UDP-glucose 4-epimerase
MIQILLTGGAGYIGSHTIIELFKSGYDIISADNFSNSSPKTYERIQRITGKSVKHYDTDLCDLSQTKKIFQENPGIKGVIHFAALKSVSESVGFPLLYYRSNINSLLNILECIQIHKIPNLIFSSSCSVYGNASQLPVNEDTPPGEMESPYAYTKFLGEQIIKDFTKVNPFIKALSLRYFNPVGAHSSGLNGEIPGDRPSNLVPAITQCAIGKTKEMSVFGSDYNTRDGSCIRDYIHVSDIAEAHVKAFKYVNGGKQNQGYSLFNLGSGNGVTVLEAIKAFEKISKQKLNYKMAPRRTGDVEAIYSDSSKANELLQWKPTHDINSMMETAWKWEQNISKEK